MRCVPLDNRTNRGILLDIERRLETLERMMIIMAEDFAALSAAVDTLVTEVTDVISVLQNPAVDNNNQSTIDSLTSKLSAAASALSSALPAAPATTSSGPANGDPNTSPAPAGDGTTTPAPTDGSTSGDQTPA